MKKVVAFFVLYLLFPITSVIGNIYYCKLSEEMQKSFSGVQTLFVVGGLTVVILVLLISARALINNALHGKRAIISNCVTLAISVTLFLCTLLSPAISTFLPMRREALIYSLLMLLASDVFNFTIQLKKLNPSAQK